MMNWRTLVLEAGLGYRQAKFDANAPFRPEWRQAGTASARECPDSNRHP